MKTLETATTGGHEITGIPTRHGAEGPGTRAYNRNMLHSRLYCFHMYRVMGAEGVTVGLVDWIWADEAAGNYEFIATGQNWLTGTVRPIPAGNIRVNHRALAVYVPFTRDQIKNAPRCAIGAELRDEQKQAIQAHYGAGSR